ncbi:hypothetical protein CUN65_15640 [Enterobacter hormaechei subsp. xiangfangensis]|nr:hypothetical protein CU081_20490 [Enterobacter sp. CRENT-193]AVO83089.1 hypothetical protein AM472_11850 [Enterobacter cloacae complex sp.]AWR69698.1 hypothetical protein CUN65_15640 [Enterobacter hormaechei subsp. xiangfangensis]AYU95092.1 hypothetical protein EEI76_08355 [Enterobacter cloacae]KAA0877323.1 hypothetical protein EYC90_18675 [Enterobacter hormaechei]RYA49524.1 hypothetical protein DD606_20660 [Enterobacter cloacae complex sp. GF14B]HAS1742663.1 hypothetical protein [Enteroba
MLPSVLLMRRVCGLDVQCQLMNLYAIKMIKYYFNHKKKRITHQVTRSMNTVLCICVVNSCAQTLTPYAR